MMTKPEAKEATRKTLAKRAYKHAIDVLRRPIIAVDEGVIAHEGHNPGEYHICASGTAYSGKAVNAQVHGEDGDRIILVKFAGQWLHGVRLPVDLRTALREAWLTLQQLNAPIK
jgi:hypothetical protein